MMNKLLVRLFFIFMELVLQKSILMRSTILSVGRWLPRIHQLMHGAFLCGVREAANIFRVA